MAQLTNCRRCGKVFPKEYRDVCQQCAEIEVEDVRKICDYAEGLNKPHISIEEISENTGISQKDIDLYLKRGRLSRIIKKIQARCRICGATINDTTKKGLVCDSCVKQMGRDPEQRKTIDEINNSQTIKVRVKVTNKAAVQTAKEEEEQKRARYGFKRDYE